MKILCYFLALFLARPAMCQADGSNWDDIVKQDAETFLKSQGTKGKVRVKLTPEMLTPGSGGLVFQGQNKSSTATASNISALYSELSVSRKGGFIISTIKNLNAEPFDFTFKNRSNLDPGYVSDAFWMNQHRSLILRFGRFSDFDGWFFYCFDAISKKVSRISRTEVADDQFAPSPDKRYLVYVDRPTAASKSHYVLRVWDSVTKKSFHIQGEGTVNGQITWRNTTDFVFTVSKSKRGSESSCLVGNVATRKLTPFKHDVQSLVFSPDKKQILYSIAAGRKTDGSLEPSNYQLNNLVRPQTMLIPTPLLGKYSPGRQISWTYQPSVIVSVLNHSETPRRIFVCDLLHF